jgi:hypothetical protein
MDDIYEMLKRFLDREESVRRWELVEGEEWTVFVQTTGDSEYGDQYLITIKPD